MKTILIISLLLSNSTQWIFSQNFEPIVDTSKMWVEYIIGSEALPTDIGESLAYKIKDSALISENYWMKLWESSDSSYTEWEHIAYLKEKDSIVLYMDLSSNIDTLYDFTKKPGEKIVRSVCEDSIISIDKTNFIGKERLTVHLQYDQFYEGIGGNAGLLSPLHSCMVGADFYFLCYYENGELKYHNEDFNSCYYNTTAVFNTNIQTIKVYPNPIIDKINIDNIETNSLLNIYNSMGQIVYSKELTAKNNSIILPDFKGFCIIKLTSKKGDIIYSKSFIK